MRRKIKRKKNDGRGNIAEFFLEMLFWIPELLLFPIRMVVWLMRGIGKIIKDIFDIV
ncbi:hypothetical protein [Aquibacillus rhizosphaerae]|uniref:Uncharacterized protein n=1 Tax=Aquibacillus rhizosphaerae TaxID=3051431 RepID=A0ABT7LB20_9BACI|nr:hypothetical protein [Aquibacillus sp. LR5S19]MDL4843057.1 hypothetical protein [Aquibacillus sp. LR5S19]